MNNKEQIEQAKQYLFKQGYGIGSNFTVNTVANLMAEWAARLCNKPAVSKRALPVPGSHIQTEHMCKVVHKPPVCRQCGSDSISFDMDANTLICDACNKKAI